MGAIRVYVEKPPLTIFEDIDVFVRYLPYQMIEIFFGFGRWNGLVNGITANRFRAL